MSKTSEETDAILHAPPEGEEQSEDEREKNQEKQEKKERKARSRERQDAYIKHIRAASENAGAYQRQTGADGISRLGLSRASSKSSMGSKDDLSALDPESHPFRQLVHPIAAGTIVAMKSKTPSDDLRRNIRRAIRDVLKEEQINAVTRSTKKLVHSWTDKYNFVFDPEVLKPFLSDDQSEQERKKWEEEKKLLSSRYKQQFAASDNKINTFLNEFVKLINRYNVPKSEAEDYFETFFTGELRGLVEMYLRRFDLQYAIDHVRKFKGTPALISEHRQKVQEFTKLPNKNIREKLFDVWGHVIMGHPETDDHAVLEMYKDKVTGLLPRDLQYEVTREEDMTRQRLAGEGMGVDQFIELVVNLANRSSQRAAAVNQVELQLPSHVLTTEHIPEIIRAIQNTMQVQAPAQPSTGNPSTGAIAKARNEYVHNTHPQYHRARQVVSRDFLVDRSLPENPMGFPQFSKDQGNKIWPTPPLRIERFPDRLAVFYKDGRTGRLLYTREIQSHMRGKCVVCGLPGHSPTSRNCPYYGQPSVNDLCPTCRAGFHSTCKYPDAVIAAAGQKN